MLSKCANPGCPATFLYLHVGKLFRMDTTVEVHGPRSGCSRRKAGAARRILLVVR